MGNRFKLKKKYKGPDQYIVSNSPMPDKLPDDVKQFWENKEFLHPYPKPTDNQYIFKKGIIGAAGFYKKEAEIFAEACKPNYTGYLIAISSIAPKILKEIF